MPVLRSRWQLRERKIAPAGSSRFYGAGAGHCVEFAGVAGARLGQAGAMNTSIRVGEIPGYPNQASCATVTDSQMEDSRMLLEQLLQVARISALEEMASGIAHELNQPIGAITTFAQAGQRMLNRPEPMIEQAAEVLRHISNEALNAGEGIRRIRSLFHGHRAQHTDCDLASVIAELMPVLELLALRSGATLQFTSQQPLPAVAIDKLRIQHVLFTLVQNALEAPTRNGETPSVRIDVSGDRYSVRVAVEDRGLGIPDDAREQLFRPFFTTKARGTGLGLASSRAIAESHQGSLDVENVAAGGARFCLRLPASAQHEEVEA
jgi:C4-dicarboxylate-specific signal transduction histidine kinase